MQDEKTLMLKQFSFLSSIYSVLNNILSLHPHHLTEVK